MLNKPLRLDNRTVEIISIGNELLIGHTLDTNSHWIAKRITRMGWTLQRITQIRDSLSEISSGILESIRRNPGVLITIGGLGPTYDDMTLSGIARALRTRMGLNREALELVKERYRKLQIKPRLTSYRRKMATLPRGSRPLPNPVGTAPGVMLKVGRTTLLSLPGVPSEMRAIFRRSVIPLLKTTNGKSPTNAQLKIAGIIESALAPILDSVRRAYPRLYFKSHPRGRETGVRPLILLHIYNVQPDSEADVLSAVGDVIMKLAEIR